MWDIKLNLIDTDTSVVVTIGEGKERAIKGKGSQIYGSRR